MELWYTEQHTENVRFSIKVSKQIFSMKSEFQQIDIFESPEFGRFLVIDGLMMLTERDEFIYHEMITHVPMSVLSAKNVLVIGGGDGGTVRELLRYPDVSCVDLVEIDKMVIDSCKEFIPSVAGKLSDSRVKIYYEDGLKFIRDKHNVYDLIIVDSTDPFGPGEGLFTKEFYGNCFKALTESGILVNQHESPYYESYAESMIRAHNNISDVFPICEVYQAHIPTYPSGHWLFGFASKKLNPIDDFNPDNWRKRGFDSKYYNEDIHKGAFCLPSYVKKYLGGDTFGI